MENISELSTTAIVQELLRRAEHTDALLALVNGGGAYRGGRQADPPPRMAPKTGSSRIPTREVLDALKSAARPLTAAELCKRIPRASISVASSALARAFRSGAAERHGNRKPYSYSAK